ncbi:MAG TPA: hypothetical protein VMT93_02140 [Gemmatimonadaceae bacterium]|nr:hypothetical protein [Gemmatimonadaceae bacterium]
MRRVVGLGLLVVIMAAPGWGQAAHAADTLAARVARLPSPSTATWLSVGLTVGPALAGAVIASNNAGNAAGSALFLGGAILGPAAGFWYGGVGGKAWPGILIRTGGLVLMTIGAEGCLGDAIGGRSCSTNSNGALIGGTVLLLGSAIYDMATVGKKVREHDAALERAMVVPIFVPSQRRVGAGVVIVGF